jgi:hypothetical protein
MFAISFLGLWPVKLCFRNINLKVKNGSITHVCPKQQTRGNPAERLYINRTPGSDCHHRIIDGNTDAGAAKGQEAGTGDYLQVQSETVWYGNQDVFG